MHSVNVGGCRGILYDGELEGAVRNVADSFNTPDEEAAIAFRFFRVDAVGEQWPRAVDLDRVR